jgi:lysophospholipase L1-like esterase
MSFREKKKSTGTPWNTFTLIDMSFLENRYYRHTEKKSPDVYRIVCLGDSLTFGCGVPSCESLPSQLETLLNRTVWEPIVEVVNAGICGFSLYDDWNFYLHEIHRYQPDYVVIVLCQNDPELFSAQKDYRDHLRACWEEQGTHLPYFKRAVAAIGEQVSALGLRCSLAFYDISGDQENENYASVIKGICDKSGLGFIDIAAEFTGEFSGKRNPAMSVNTVDRHPSRLAHQIAAQKLSRYLARNKHLPQSNAFACEKELYRKVEGFGAFLRECGLQPEACIHRTGEILDAKRNGRARIALGPDLLIDEKEYSRLQGALADAMEFSRRALFLEGLAERFTRNSTAFYQDMEGAQRSILNIEKSIFILGENARNPSFSYYPPLRKMDDADFSTFPSRFNALLEIITMIKSNYLTTRQQSAGDMLPAFRPMQEESAVKVVHAASTVESFLETLCTKLQSANDLFSRFCKLFDASKDRLSAKSVSSAFVQVSHELMSLLNQMQKAIASLQLHEINQVSFGNKRAPFTTLSASIKSSSGLVPNVIVTSESIIPHRQLLREMQYVVNDGRSHVYSFSFPLLALGRFCVFLTSAEQTVIESIDVYNTDSRVIHYQDISGQSEINLPVVLIPV